MSIRALSRRLWIYGAAALRLDHLARRKLRTTGPGGTHVRVVLAHGTPRASADAFRRQLEWASRHFEFIDFTRFRQLWGGLPASGGERATGDARPKVLFTFDDGMLSNHEVGAPILEEFGTRGVFFVVPRFSLSPAGEEARRYFRDHLKGMGDDCQPMVPQQIRDLADRGHTIGNHTYSHVRLSETPDSALAHEIAESADLIESWTSRPVEAFAWTFYWNAITPAAYRSIIARHPFCFTPCPGVVDPRSDQPSLLWRTNVEADAELPLVRFMYSGLADGIWASRRSELARMLDAGNTAPDSAGLTGA